MKHDLFGRTNNPNQEFLDALERYVQALSSTLHQLPSLIEPSRHSHVIVKRLAEAGGDDRRMRQLLSKAQASMGWRARWKKDLIRDEANVAKKLARRFSRLANDYDVLHWELEQLVDPNPINHKPVRVMSDTSETLKQTARRLDHHEGPRPLPEIIVEFQDHLELTTGRWWDTEVAEIFSALPRQRKVFTAGNIGQYPPSSSPSS